MRMYEVDPVKPSAVTHFDWLTLVFPVYLDGTLLMWQPFKDWLNQWLTELKINSLIFTPLDHGIYSYPNAMVSGDNSIIVGWPSEDQLLAGDGDGKNTWMLQISGAGVETIESMGVNYDFTIANFIDTAVNKLQATFSRVDPCCNFFNYPKEYSARYVGEEAKKGNLVTRASTVRLVRRFSSKGAKDDADAYQGVSEGYTCYVGKNPKQLRVYNKLAERSDKVNLRYQVKSWSRWEFQLNGVNAQAFMDAYIHNDYDLVQTWTDWLATNYRWIERVGHQEKRSRYPNAKWFDNLVKSAKEKIKVRSGRQSPTFERQAKWIDNQVMPTLATIYYARFQKYQENGLTSDDAKKLAIKKLVDDLEAQAMDQKVNWSQVSTFVEEIKNEAWR